MSNRTFLLEGILIGHLITAGLVFILLGLGVFP